MGKGELRSQLKDYMRAKRPSMFPQFLPGLFSPPVSALRPDIVLSV